MTQLKLDFPEKDFFVRLFGRDVYAVGGYVRDLVRKAEADREVDLLIARHGVPEIIQKLEPHGKVDVVGKSFGVIKFHREGRGYDIAMPRKDFPKKIESAELRGHKDFVISADPDLPVEEDLRRRDFCCNSIALRLIDGEMIDPLAGLDDIQKKILRLTNPKSFPDDPLRVLRAARFASVLGFSLDQDIYRLSKDTDLSGLSVERVNEEVFKILIASPLPSVGLEELFQLGALRQLFPELYGLTLSIQDAVFHPEKDRYGHHTVWHHTKITVDQAARLAALFHLEPPKKLALLLAALFHDVGKPGTAHWEYKRGRMVITNNGHDISSEKITKKTLDRLKIFSWNGHNIRKTSLSLIKCHHRASELWQNRDVITKKAFNRLAADVDGEIELLAYLDAADRAGRDEKPVTKLDREARWFLRKFKELNITRETIKPLIMGRDLIKIGVSPGPSMGKILKTLYQRQLDNEFETKRDGLKIARDILPKEKT